MAENEEQGQALTDEEEQDLSIMVDMAEEMIDDGGYEVVTQALEQSKDPGQVIGQFMMQLASQLGEELRNQGIDINPKIMFAVGGWVEEISDYLQDEYDVPRDVMDRAEIYIGTSAQQMAQQQQQGAAPQQQMAPEQGGPVLPQGAA